MSADPEHPLIATMRNTMVDRFKDIIETLGFSTASQVSDRTSGYTHLCSALRNKQMKVAITLIRDRAAVNSNSRYYSKTPLHYACENDYEDVVWMLLRRGANINAIDESGKTGLHYAIENDAFEVVILLLREGARLDITDVNPVYLAVANNNSGIAERLLSHGATITTRRDKRSPLHLALEREKYEMLRGLLEQGADPNVRNEKGKTIFEIAVAKGNLELAQELIQYYYDLWISKRSGVLYNSLIDPRTDFDRLVDRMVWGHGFRVFGENARDVDFVHMVARRGDIRVFERLVKLGANINGHHPKNRRTLLHTASIPSNSACILIVEYLLERGVERNSKDQDGKTPITLALQYRNHEIARLLLSGPSAVKVTTKVLHTAVKNVSLPTVQHILENNSNLDLNDRDKLGRTVLHLIVADEYFKYVYSAHFNSKEYRDPKDPFDDRFIMAGWFLARGAKVDAKSKAGDTPLHFAAGFGYFKVAELYLKHNADINAVTGYNRTPLYTAAFKNNVEMVRLLLDKGADINVRYRDGTTPLHISVEKGHLEVVKMLVEHAEKMNINDNDGSDALYISTYNDKSKVVRTLWDFGSNVDLKDNFGRTSLHIAAKQGFPEIAETLIKHGANVNVTCEDPRTKLEEMINENPDNNIRLNDDTSDERIRESVGRHKVAAVLKRQIILMIALELNVHKKNLGYIDINLYRNRFTECKVEIARMKSLKIRDTNVTYYDVLTRSIDQLATYLRNETIVKAFEEEDYLGEFPCYETILVRRFKLGQKKERLISSGSKALDTIFRCNLPTLMAGNVLQYLDDKDLKNLVAAADNERFRDAKREDSDECKNATREDNSRVKSKKTADSSTKNRKSKS